MTRTSRELPQTRSVKRKALRRALIQDFLRRGGQLWACTPCVKARGYGQDDLVPGVEIAGSSKMHERIKAGGKMAEATQELVVMMTHGADHELSSVAFTIANRGMTAGLKVSVFLTSAAVDLVRKKAIDMTHVEPLEPLAPSVVVHGLLLPGYVKDAALPKKFPKPVSPVGERS